jgi:hypothetical protein
MNRKLHSFIAVSRGAVRHASVLAILVAKFLFYATPIQAQLAIGSLDKPQEFSILELSGGGKRGLRLPQLTTEQRNDLHLENLEGDQKTAAMGLQIFNLNTLCVETWNGTRWIQQCDESGPCCAPCLSTNFPISTLSITQAMIATIPIDDGEDYNDEGYLQFLTFNLGADPTLSPRDQIAFCDDKTEDASFTDPFNVALYGGFYQWGRNNDGSQFRCQKTDDGANDDLFSEVQIVGEDYKDNVLNYSSQFVWTEETMNQQFDWITPSDRTLWGNGLDVDNQPKTHFETDNNSDWNDPCPDGWRVPTQYEWRLITGEPYEINPSSSQYGYFVPVENTKLVWVRFSDGKIVTVFPKKDDNKDDAGNYFYNNGYAIFDKHSSIEDVFAVGRKIEEIVEAEPLMYIPAAGYRLFADARVEGVGETGYYWTATNIGDASAKYIHFHNTGLNPDDAEPRSTGCSVRCVKKILPY